VPLRRLGWDFRVFEDGQEAAILDLAVFRRRGVFTVAGVTYAIRRTGLLFGAYVLEPASGGRVLARAERAGLRTLRVHAGDRVLGLRGAGLLGRRFLVLHGERRVGVVRREGWLSWRVAAEFSEQLALPIRIFLAAVAIVSWRAASRGASSGGG